MPTPKRERSRYCPTCGVRHMDDRNDRTECAKCARLRSLLVERYTTHKRGKADDG